MQLLLLFIGITFEQTVYSVTEGVGANVELCAILTSGALDRGEAVVTLSTSDGTATSSGLCVCVYIYLP